LQHNQPKPEVGGLVGPPQAAGVAILKAEDVPNQMKGPDLTARESMLSRSGSPPGNIPRIEWLNEPDALQTRIAASEFNYRKGVEIYGEKEPADYVYQVISGAVRTYKLLSDGRLIKLGVLEALNAR
jgi:hypothetical protein